MAEIIDRDPTTRPAFSIYRRDGLKVFIGSAWVEFNNITALVESKELTLPASEAEIFIFVNPDTKEIEFNITGWPAECKQLYKMATDAGAIISEEDFRTSARHSQHTCYKTHTEYLVSENTNIDIDWGLIDLDSVSGLTLPADIKGVLAYVGITDSGSPGAGVFASFRKPGASVIQEGIRLYPQISGIWTSAAVPIGINSDHEFERKIKVSGTFQLRMTLLGLIWGM